MLALSYLERLDRMLAAADGKVLAATPFVVAVVTLLPAATAPRLFSRPPFGGEPIDLEPIGWYLLGLTVTLVGAVITAFYLWRALHPRTKPECVLAEQKPSLLRHGTFDGVR